MRNLFRDQPELTNTHRKKLAPFLRNAAVLTKWLAEHSNLPDKKRMVLLEIEGKHRPGVVHRLLGSIYKTEKEEVFATIFNKKK